MITGITQHGRYTVVSNGSAMSLPYVNNINSNDPSLGDVRVVNGQLSCWIGSSWAPITGSYPSVGLTGEAELLLDWAREQKNKQAQREQLIRNHPALQKAYEAIKRAEENFDIIEKFVENDTQSEEQTSG